MSAMAMQLPSLDSVVNLVACLDEHPVGGLLLICFTLAIAAGLWAYRFSRIEKSHNQRRSRR
jgi:hypothetical protein